MSIMVFIMHRLTSADFFYSPIGYAATYFLPAAVGGGDCLFDQLAVFNDDQGGVRPGCQFAGKLTRAR